jgi:hypothetical protein
VAPTVLDLARVALAPEAAADGVSLASYLRRPEAPGRPVAILGRGIRDERFKVDFTMNPDTLFSARRPDVSSLAGHVYDLKNDPGETRDLWSERPDVVLNLLDAYRARVGPSHARQAAAISERTPAFPFALSASWFDLPGVSSSQVSAPMALPRGVQATFDATRAWPLSVSVPDGRYRLSVQVKGKGWITVDGRSSRVSGPPAESSFDEAGRDADLGDVVVTNRRLRLFVQASGSRDLAVLRLGLVPARLPAPDGDLDEKLRALGYLGKVR